ERASIIWPPVRTPRVQEIADRVLAEGRNADANRQFARHYPARRADYDFQESVVKDAICSSCKPTDLRVRLYTASTRISANPESSSIHSSMGWNAAGRS